MAQDATAVNDAPITDATDSAPVQTSETSEDLDSFDLDDSDFKPSTESTDDEGSITDDEADTEPDEGVEDTKPDDTPEETDDTDTDTNEPADKPSKEDKRQDFIRNLVNERNDYKRQVAELNAKVYESRTPEQLQAEVNPDTGEYYTALEARVIAAEEKQALRDYNDQVADAQLAINTDARSVITDFPMFDESSKDFNKDIASQADQLLADNLIRDPNTEQTDKDGNRIPGTGQIVGQHLPTYQLYKLINDAVNIGKTNGVLEGQKATKKMLAAADTPTSGGPKDNKKDAFADAFDKELDRF